VSFIQEITIIMTNNELTNNELSRCVRMLIEGYGEAIRNGETSRDVMFATHDNSGLIDNYCYDTIIGRSEVKNGSEHETQSLTTSIVAFLEHHGVRAGTRWSTVYDEHIRYIVFPRG
jgi:hypothetical protein